MASKSFIFCSDSGLEEEINRLLNHTRNRVYIVTQSIRKLAAEYREPALNREGFRRLSDNKLVNWDQLSETDDIRLYYKKEPYSTKKLEHCAGQVERSLKRLRVF